MNRKIALFSLILGALVVGCGGGSSSEGILSQRYVHKYGYDVPKEDWESNQYPGQIITTLKDGVSIAESYEEGVLHGPRTITHPHSQTLASLEMYQQGELKKRVAYSIRGVPQKEEAFISSEERKITTWYYSGSPRSVEEYSAEVLIAGEYFNPSNELDSKIEHGSGQRTLRNAFGDLLAKEVFHDSIVTYRETFHANGTPQLVASFEDDHLHGVRQEFAFSGEPIVIEHWEHGYLEGLVTRYQNGSRYEEVPYHLGQKHGTSRRFIDGTNLVEETNWMNGKKHGSSVLFIDGVAKTTWYFNNNKVSRARFDDLNNRVEYIAAMNRRSQ